MNLAEVLKQWRYGARLTLREAGDRIGVHYATLSRIEQGGEMSGPILAEILKWLLEPAKETMISRTEGGDGS